MAEAASKAEKSESMEEILQSIRRIMDDSSGAETPPQSAAEADVFDLTNVVKDDAPMAEPTPPTPAPKAVAPEEIAKTVEPTFATKDPVPEVPKEEDEGLMSRNAKSAAAQALKQITETTSKKDTSFHTSPSPQLGSGKTIEDLVVEMLRPMLKSWLDENLPLIVQKIVEKEVKRIVTFHYE